MKKFLKTSLVFILIILSGTMLFGCGKKAIQTITLSVPSNTYYVGDEFDVGVKLTPDKASREDLIWEVNNKLIASINDGHVKVIGKGKLIITAYYKKNPDIKNQITVNIIEKNEGLDLFDTTLTYNGLTQAPQYTAPQGVTVSFQYASIGSTTFIDGLPINAGSYRVKGYVVGNNDLVDICNLVIEKKDLTITVGNLSIEYSDKFVSDNVSVDVDGLVGDESYVVVAKTETDLTSAQLEVGQYALTAQITNASGEEIELANYNVIINKGTLTVSKKTVTVVPNNISGIVYGQIPNLTYTVYVGTELLDQVYLGQFVGSLDFISLDDKSKNDTGSKIITQGTLTAKNFNIVFDDSKTFDIAPKSLVLYPQDKVVLPGTVVVDFDYTTTGLLIGDIITNAFEIDSDTKEIILNPDIAIYNSDQRDITHNYNITINEGNYIKEGIVVDINIDPIYTTYYGLDYANATITQLISNTQILKDNTTISYINNEGSRVLVNTFDINTNREIEFDISTGAHIVVGLKMGEYRLQNDNSKIYATRKIEPITNGNENYVFNTSETSRYIINKIESTVTVYNSTIIYGDNKPNANIQITNQQTGQAWQLTVDTEIYNDNEVVDNVSLLDVGNYEIRPIITNNDYSMYYLTLVSGNLSINPKTINITANPITKTYGEEDPALTYVASGVDNPDDILIGNLQRIAGENVGTYTINIGTLTTANSNYAIGNFSTATFTITKAPLNITLIDTNKVYGEEDPQLRYIISGLILGDSASAVINGAPIREEGETAGQYDITSGTLALIDEDNSNYELNSISNATFTINQKNITINITTKEILNANDATSANVQYSVDGLINGDVVDQIVFVVDGSDYTVSIESISIIDELSILTTANYSYSLGVNKQAFTLVQAQAIIDIGNVITTYSPDGYELSPEYQLTTNIEGLSIETINYVYTNLDGDIVTPTNAGTYYITADITLNDNSVELTINEGILTINKAIYAGTVPQITTKTIDYENVLPKLSDVQLVEANVSWTDKDLPLTQGANYYQVNYTPDENNYYPVIINVQVVARQIVNIENLVVQLQWETKKYNGQTYNTNQFSSLQYYTADLLSYFSVSYQYRVYNQSDYITEFSNANTYETVGAITLKDTFKNLYVLYENNIAIDTTSISATFEILKIAPSIINNIPATGYLYTGSPIIVWGTDLLLYETIQDAIITIMVNGNTIESNTDWPSANGNYVINLSLTSQNYEIANRTFEYKINKQALQISYTDLRDSYVYSDSLSINVNSIGLEISPSDIGETVNVITRFYSKLTQAPSDIEDNASKKLDSIASLYNSNQYLVVQIATNAYEYYEIVDDVIVNQGIRNAGVYYAVTMAENDNYEGNTYQKFIIEKVTQTDVKLRNELITAHRTTTNEQLWDTLTNNIISAIDVSSLLFKIQIGNKTYSIKKSNNIVTVYDNENNQINNLLNIIKPLVNSNYTMDLVIEEDLNHKEYRKSFKFNTIKETITLSTQIASSQYYTGTYIVPTVTLSGDYFTTEVVITSQDVQLRDGNTLVATINCADINEIITIVYTTVVNQTGDPILPINASSHIYKCTISVELQENTYFEIEPASTQSIYSIEKAQYRYTYNGTVYKTYDGQPVNISEHAPITITNNNGQNISVKYVTGTTSDPIYITVRYALKNSSTYLTNPPTDAGSYDIYYKINYLQTSNFEVINAEAEIKGSLEIIQYSLTKDDITVLNATSYDKDVAIPTIYVPYIGAQSNLNIIKDQNSSAPFDSNSVLILTYNNSTDLPTSAGTYLVQAKVQGNNNIAPLDMQLVISSIDISNSAKTVSNKAFNYGEAITYNVSELSNIEGLTTNDVDIGYYTIDGQELDAIVDAGTYQIRVTAKIGGNYTGAFVINNIIVDKLSINDIIINSAKSEITNIYNNNLFVSNNLQNATLEIGNITTDNNYEIAGQYVFGQVNYTAIKANTTDGNLYVENQATILSLNSDLTTKTVGSYTLECKFVSTDKNITGESTVQFNYIVTAAPTADKNIYVNEVASLISVTQTGNNTSLRYSAVQSYSNVYSVETDQKTYDIILENNFSLQIINNEIQLIFTPNVNESTYTVMYDKEYNIDYVDGSFVGEISGTTSNGYTYQWTNENNNVVFKVIKIATTYSKSIELLGGQYRENENFEYGNIEVNIEMSVRDLSNNLYNPKGTIGDELSGSQFNLTTSEYQNYQPNSFVSLSGAEFLNPRLTLSLQGSSQTIYYIEEGDTFNQANQGDPTNYMPLPSGTYNTQLTLTLPSLVWYAFTTYSVDFTVSASQETITLTWTPQSIQDTITLQTLPTFDYTEQLGSTYQVDYYNGDTFAFTVNYTKTEQELSASWGNAAPTSFASGLYSYKVNDASKTFINNNGFFVLYTDNMFDNITVQYKSDAQEIVDKIKVADNNDNLEVFSLESDVSNLTGLIDINFINNNIAYCNYDEETYIITGFNLPVSIVTYCTGENDQIYVFDGNTTINIDLYENYIIVPQDISKTYDGENFDAKAVVYKVQPCISESSLVEVDSDYVIDIESANAEEKITRIDGIITATTNSSSVGSYVVTFETTIDITISGTKYSTDLTHSTSVKIVKATPSFVIDSPLIYTYDGQSKNVSVQVFGVNEEVINNAVVIVEYKNILDSNGTYSTVAPINAGQYEVKITCSAANYYGEYYTKLVINKAVTNVIVDETIFKYSGSVQKPTITVESVISSNYTINYSNANSTNVGEYTATIVVDDTNYIIKEDQYVISYTIRPTQVSTLKLSVTNYIYDGQQHIPNVMNGQNVVNNDGQNIIITNPTQSTNVGTYTIKIEGSNNYSGKAELSYTISPATLNVNTTSSTTFVYNKSIQKPTYTVTSPTVNVSTSDYNVTYYKNGQEFDGNSIDVGNYKIVIKSTNDNIVGGKEIEYIINPYNVTIQTNNLEKTYGDITSPSITVLGVNNEELTLSDYTLTFDNSNIIPTEVGDYDVKVTIINHNYTGALSTKYIIRKYQADITVTNLTQTYNGYEIEPTVVVSGANGTTLTKGVDYTIVYKQNNQIVQQTINAGEYELFVTLINDNYDGYYQSTFVIQRIVAEVQILTNNFDYDAQEHNLEYKMVYGDNDVVEQSNNVSTIKYNNEVVSVLKDVGTYEITVVMISANYEAYISTTIEVYKKQADIVVTNTQKFYSGNPQSATILVNGIGDEAVEYIATYSGEVNAPTNAGVYTLQIVVTSQNYYGYYECNFAIDKATPIVNWNTSTNFEYGAVTISEATAIGEGTIQYLLNGEGKTIEELNNLSAGVYIIIAQYSGDSNYNSNQMAQTITIQRKDVSNEIIITNLQFQYDGEDKEPTVSVPYGLDYTISYNGQESLPNAVGMYDVVVTINNNNYCGSQSATMQIISSDIPDDTELTQFAWQVEQFEYNKGEQVSFEAATSAIGTITYQVDDNNTFATITELNDYINSNPSDNYKITALLLYDEGQTQQISYYIIFKSILATATVTNVSFNVGNAISLGIIANPVTATYQTTYYNAQNKQIDSLDNLSAGNYYVIVEFTGNYVGQYRFDFIVKKKTTYINWNPQEFVYNGQDFSTSIQNATVSGISDATITYNIETPITNVGSYTITATYAGNDIYQSCQKTIVVKVNPAEADIAINELSSEYNANIKYPQITVTGVADNLDEQDYTIQYKHNGQTVSSIVDAGVYEIIVKVTNTNYYGEAIYNYTVTKKQAQIIMTDTEVDYNGLQQTPAITVSGVSGALATTCYTITYNDSTTLPLNAGEYIIKVVVTDSNYYGYLEQTFVINKVRATINVSDLEKVYNGYVQTPTIAVQGLGGENISTYTVVYKNNSTTVQSPINADVYDVEISLDNNTNYYGKAQFTFVINKANATINISNCVVVYNGNPQQPSVVVNGVNSTNLTQNDYTVKFKKDDSIVSNMTNSGLYEVEVVITNNNYFGTKTAHFTIEKYKANITMTNLVATYTGEEQEPTILVRGLSGVGMVAGRDYTVSYNDTSNKPLAYGEYVVKVNVINPNYYGYAQEYFVIQKAKANILIVNNNLKFVYNNNIQKPNISVVGVNGNLIINSDYTVTYYSNGELAEPKEAGVYSIVVDITNTNYEGQSTYYMIIERAPIDSVTLDIGEQSLSSNNGGAMILSYDGGVFEASYTVKRDNLELVQNNDFDVKYLYSAPNLTAVDDIEVDDISQTGRYTVVVEGKNNYKDRILMYVIVNPEDKEYAISTTSYMYTGNNYIQDIKSSINDSEGQVVEASKVTVYNYYDLSQVLEEVIDAGTYLVKVTSINEKTYEFVVTVSKKQILFQKQQDNGISSNTLLGKLTLSSTGSGEPQSYTVLSSNKIFKYSFNIYDEEGYPSYVSVIIYIDKDSKVKILYTCYNKNITGVEDMNRNENYYTISIDGLPSIRFEYTEQTELSDAENISNPTSINNDFWGYIIINAPEVADANFAAENVFYYDYENNRINYMVKIDNVYYGGAYIYNSVTNRYEYDEDALSGGTTEDTEEDEVIGQEYDVIATPLLRSYNITIVEDNGQLMIEGDNFVVHYV